MISQNEYITAIRLAHRPAFIAGGAVTLVGCALLLWAALYATPVRSASSMPDADAYDEFVFHADARHMPAGAMDVPAFRHGWQLLVEVKGMTSFWSGRPLYTAPYGTTTYDQAIMQDVAALVDSQNPNHMLLAAALIRQTYLCMECRLHAWYPGADGKKAIEAYYDLVERWVRSRSAAGAWGRNGKSDKVMASLFAFVLTRRICANGGTEATAQKEFIELLGTENQTPELLRGLKAFIPRAGFARQEGESYYDTLMNHFRQSVQEK